MPRFEYSGIAYRQATSPTAPVLVSFVAPAEEILRWASIPRRTDYNVSGFQRTEDEARIRKAKAYFDSAENQSPTALVLGIHPVGVDAQRVVRLELGEERNGIRPCKLVVDFDDELGLDAAVERVRRQAQYRLAQEPPEEIEVPEEEEAADVFDESAEAAEPEAADENLSAGGAADVEPAEAEAEIGEEEEAVELGRSVLGELLVRLDDAAWREGQREHLLDLAKPATVIDGQHRVLAARRCERGIPFAVLAMFDCPWAEQVFQFTVVNYTAKGIPDQFITANAALSLTKAELDQLEQRLVKAGVKVIEYELMKVVHFDDASPFYQLVNLTEKKDPTRIGYRTMVRVAKEWYDAKHMLFRVKILPNLYPTIKGRGARAARVRKWRDEDWGRFFIEFWRVVENHYRDYPTHNGHTLWEVGHSNLMRAVVLLELQRAFFTHLNAQDPSFFSVGVDPTKELIAKISRRAEDFVKWLPYKFFGEKWLYTSLDVGPGRLILQDTLRQLIDTNGQYRWQRSPIVTGLAQQS